MTVNFTNNLTDSRRYDIARNEPIVRYTFYGVYGLVVLLGFAGNVLVVYVVVRNKSMHSITNIFIANLATSDILMSLVAAPFTPIALYMENWLLPNAICKILPMTMGVSVYVSTLTSTAIAVERYFIIVHPFLTQMRTWLCFFIIVAVWITAILISMPLAVYQQKESDNKTNQSTCSEKWPKDSTKEVFTVVSFVLQFVVPCSIISVCYLKVSMVLKHRLKFKLNSGSKNREKEVLEIRRTRRTNKMLIAMVMIFVICWIPLNTLLMVNDLMKGALEKKNFFSLVFLICHVLAMSSAVYNPFLYAWMTENFKKEFRMIIPCVFPNSRFDEKGFKGSSRLTYQYSTIDHVEQPSGVRSRRSSNRDANGEPDNSVSFNRFNETVNLVVDMEQPKPSAEAPTSGGSSE